MILSSGGVGGELISGQKQNDVRFVGPLSNREPEALQPQLSCCPGARLPGTPATKAPGSSSLPRFTRSLPHGVADLPTIPTHGISLTGVNNLPKAGVWAAKPALASKLPMRRGSEHMRSARLMGTSRGHSRVAKGPRDAHPNSRDEPLPPHGTPHPRGPPHGVSLLSNPRFLVCQSRCCGAN
jgi:hypothetical protein